MHDADLAFLPAHELRALVAGKQISPVEVTALYLQRIEALDGQLNAYLTVTADLALAAARQAEQAVMAARPLGPLGGVPISIKDLEVTRGVRTTLGSLIFQALCDGILTKAVHSMPMDIFSKAFLFAFYFGLFF